MLPLDLHVLGLSLAFILSQDQTLHCIFFLFFSFGFSMFPVFLIDVVPFFLFFFLNPFQTLRNFPFPILHLVVAFLLKDLSPPFSLLGLPLLLGK